MRGKVKTWFDMKGFGFIIGEDDQSYFIHQGEIMQTGWRKLLRGQGVEFTPYMDEKGPAAREVWPDEEPLQATQSPYPISFRDQIVQKVIDELRKERENKC